MWQFSPTFNYHNDFKTFEILEQIRYETQKLAQKRTARFGMQVNNAFFSTAIMATTESRPVYYNIVYRIEMF